MMYVWLVMNCRAADLVVDSRHRYRLSGCVVFSLGKFKGCIWWQPIWFQGISRGLPPGSSLSLLFHVCVRIWSGESNTVCMIVLPECQFWLCTDTIVHSLLPVPPGIGDWMRVKWFSPNPNKAEIIIWGCRKPLVKVVLAPSIEDICPHFYFLDFELWIVTESSTSIWEAVAHCIGAVLYKVLRPSS